MAGRPSWDQYFLGIAAAVALRGDCKRSRVGAVLVEDRTRRILSTGFNGVRPGELGCLDGGCPRGSFSLSELPPYGSYDNCVARHAESNCVGFWRDIYTVKFEQLSMYITRKPCDGCSELLVAVGVERAVWPDGEVSYL